MLHISKGNKKLVSNTDVRFLIWSLPPIITCPFSTELCKKFCYAMKAFRAYPNARNAWSENLEESKKDGFKLAMIDAILNEIEKPKYNKAKQIVFRIHESGDFYNKKYATAWVAVARYFENFATEPNASKIKFMAYTKSIEYFKGEDIPKNMVIRFSLWDDTDPRQYELAKAMGLPIYTAVEKFTDEPKRERCECVNCGTCTKCWSKKFEMLKCEIH